MAIIKTPQDLKFELEEIWGSMIRTRNGFYQLRRAIDTDAWHFSKDTSVDLHHTCKAIMDMLDETKEEVAQLKDRIDQ